MKSNRRYVHDDAIKYLDFRAFRFFAKLIIFGKGAEWRNLNVPKVFAKTVEAMPDKIMFYFEDRTWTFKEVC